MISDPEPLATGQHCWPASRGSGGDCPCDGRRLKAKKIVYWTRDHAHRRANGAFLISCFTGPPPPPASLPAWGGEGA
jgi:hypothetical protein